MKTPSSALTDSSMRFATVVFPEPVPPQMPMIKLKLHLHPTVNSAHHAAQQLRERFAHTVSRRHHFLVIDRLIADARGHVCDTRDAEHLHAHVPRHDRFRRSEEHTSELQS